MITMKREMGKKLIAAQHVYEYILYSRLFDPLFIYTINGQQRWPKKKWTATKFDNQGWPNI